MGQPGAGTSHVMAAWHAALPVQVLPVHSVAQAAFEVGDLPCQAPDAGLEPGESRVQAVSDLVHLL
jgi:hypothetical protein